MLPEIVVLPPVELAERLAMRLEAEAKTAIDGRGRFAIALSGGSIAPVLYPRLSMARIDWPHTDFFWCDERAVPPNDPESNYGVARSLWLEPAGIAGDRVHRMKAEDPNLELAAAAYGEEMLRVLGTPPRLDVALLGVGPDGHVCSLFPGHRLLQEEIRWVAALTDAPKPPRSRLTLTPPTLAAARLIVIAAFGDAKALVVRTAIDDETSTLPLALVLRSATRVFVLLDGNP